MKLLKHISGMLLFLLVGISCSRVELDVNPDTTLEYQVNLSEMTKAFGEGDHVNYIWYALYNEDGTFFTSFNPVPVVDGVAHCTITFIKDHDYKVVFVGTRHLEDAAGRFTPIYNIDAEHGVINMPSQSVANSEDLDCFFGTDAVRNNRCVNTSVTLRRITSQLNFICKAADWPTVNAPVKSSLVLTGVSGGYDMLHERFTTDKKPVTYSKASLLTGPDQKVGADYRICSVYCLSGSDVIAQMKVYDSADAVSTPVNGVRIPIANNTKTNIYCKIQ